MGSKWKITIFVVSVISGTFDLISDWLLYSDVSGIEQGLVFGPLPTSVVASLLFFCFIGTVTYLVELVLDILNLVTEDTSPVWLLDTMNAISIWIEDVPQISLSLYIAGCRLEAVSILQMVKSVATIVEVLTSIGISLARKWYNKVKRKKSLDRSIWLSLSIGLGLTIMMTFSILVLILTHFYTDSRNVVRFASPDSFDSGHHDGSRYIEGAGIYINFDSSQNKTISMNSGEWIQVADLTEATTCQSNTVVSSVKYNSNPNTRLWVQTTTLADLTASKKSTCYNTQTTPKLVVNTCPTDLLLTSVSTSVVFKFVYQSPNSQLPLGDIHYNYRTITYNESGTCITSAASPQWSLHYFMVSRGVNYTYPLATETSGWGQFYSLGSTLKQVTDAWKTGHFKCDPTGRASPKLDTSIEVPCLTWS